MQRPRVAILGAGITGLTAAWQLARTGHEVRVFESSNRIGGAIGTDLADGWLSERGPNSILAGASEVEMVLEAVGLRPAVVAANPAARRRYVAHGGKPVPLSPAALFGGGLFSARTRLGILGEFFRLSRRRGDDATFASLIRDHFGEEVLARAAQPFVSGIYAGDPDQLSARHAFPRLWALEQRHGSILRGALRSRRSRRPGALTGIFSFGDGLQALPDALARAVPRESIRTGTAVDGVVAIDGQWRLAGAGLEEGNFDAVIVALPAPALARLSIGAAGQRPLAGLGTISHPPVSSLFLGFRREQVAHSLDGFGMLVPVADRRDILGALFSSTLFPGRAPAGHVALTVLSGGMLQPERALKEPAAQWAAVRHDLRDLLGVSGEPVVTRLTHWPQAIPQYTVGYERNLEAMAACERAHSGLFIGGNARDGVSVPDCIRSGLRLAAQWTTCLRE